MVSMVEPAPPVMGWASAQPTHALRPFVDGYLGWSVAGQAAGIHHGVPSRHVTVIISTAAPVEVVAMPEGSHGGTGRFQAPLSGLQAGSAIIARPTHESGMAIELTPLGVRALLGLPAAALAGSCVELADVLGAEGREVVERVVTAVDWTARVAAVDDVFDRLRRRVDAAPPPDGVAEAWRRLLATAGGVPIGALAAELGWSRRHLGERFRNEIGLTPKAAARVLRFERAVEALKAGRPRTLADLAVDCGYYDQAHLAREFVDLAGCPPSAWMANELPSP